MHAMDWLPTVVEAGGGGAASSTAPHPLDGVSAWTYLTTGTPPTRADLLLNIERDVPTTGACVGAAACNSHPPACNGVGMYAIIQGAYKIILGGEGLIESSACKFDPV